MKLLLASDIHGSAYWCAKLMEAIEEQAPTTVVLLGDILYHGPRNDLPRDYAPKKVIPLLNGIADSIVAVRGNCDAEVDQMVLDFPLGNTTQSITLDDGSCLLCSHGHVYGPQDVVCATATNSQGEDGNLLHLPKGSTFAYGHTHVKRLETQEGIRFVNPGSVSIPKDASNSYALYEDGEFSLHTL